LRVSSPSSWFARGSSLHLYTNIGRVELILDAGYMLVGDAVSVVASGSAINDVLTGVAWLGIVVDLLM
jgi:hypothetical protein